MLPDPGARAEYVEAFSQLAGRPAPATPTAARLLYFDRQYNDSFALMHEDTQADSKALSLAGIDVAVLDVRLLSPLDLAVSKISRFSDQDRGDIAALARRRYINAGDLRRRAQQALTGYVGNVDRVSVSIELACSIILEARTAP